MHIRRMQKPRQQQQGIYLALLAMLLVVLVGIAALVLDVGRLLALRSEMQSAVDAAALAAALELNEQPDAIDRARAAARFLLEHDSRFAEINELLGPVGLPDEAFVFYCVIGSQTDVSPDEDGFGDYCTGTTAEGNKYVAGSAEEAHYVRVTLDADLINDGRYTIALYFLPVLGVGNDEVIASEAGLRVTAVAGRAYYMCNFPPMALCDPFEGTGSHLRDELAVGSHIQLKQQGSNQWSPGNFGFLEAEGGPGAGDVAEYLADEGQLGCDPPIITTKTGSMTNKVAGGWNTRFDVYDGPAPFNKATAYQDWPPAPNIMEYPLDTTTEMTDSRFGTGDWDFDAYWAAHHPAEGKPNGWSNLSRPTRWQVYNWEIENNAVPAVGQPDPTHLHTGSYPPAISNAERRMIYVAVVSCEATGLTGGKKSTVIFNPDGFAKMFMVRQAEGPPVGEMYAEYLGWAGRGDTNYHVEVQLYE